MREPLRVACRMVSLLFSSNRVQQNTTSWPLQWRWCASVVEIHPLTLNLVQLNSLTYVYCDMCSQKHAFAKIQGDRRIYYNGTLSSKFEVDSSLFS